MAGRTKLELATGEQVKYQNLQTQWSPIHTHVLLRYSEGAPAKLIAKEMELPEIAVKRITTSVMFQRRLKDVNMDVVNKVVTQRSEVLDVQAATEARRILTESSVVAAVQIVKMAKTSDYGSRVQLEACKDILDRAGLRPVVITETRERVYSPEEVASAKAILDETQAIIERLANQSSPFVLSDMSRGKLASSVTDISSDGKSSSTAGTNRPPDVEQKPLLPV